MQLRALVLPFLLASLSFAPAQEPEVAADAAEPEEEWQEEEEAPEVLVEWPTPEQVQAMPAEERRAKATAIKSVLLLQTVRMVEEERRLTRGNFAESAELAARLDVPEAMQTALRLLASGELDPWDRGQVMRGLDAMYELFGVDVLAVRLFVETSGLELAEIREIAAWLPMGDVFNLPAPGPYSQMELRQEASALCRVYAALYEQLSTVHDRESADAAAEALLAELPDIDSTQPLRMSPSEVQGRIFATRKSYLISTHQSIQTLRAKLQKEGYYGSSRLRAVDYFLN